jgi:hypothetical protein
MKEVAEYINTQSIFLNNTLNTEKSINAVIQKFNDSKIHDDALKIGLNVNYLYGWPLSLFVINDLLNKTHDVTREEDLKFLPNKYVSKLDQIDLINVNAFQLWFDFSKKQFSWTEDFEQFINNKELKIVGWNNPLESLLISLKFHKISKCFFDSNHFISATQTILNCPKSLLNNLDINNRISMELFELIEDPQYKISELFQYEVDLISQIGLEDRVYSSSQKSYFFIQPFLKKIANLNNSSDIYRAIIPKLINLFSNQSKKNYLDEFKAKKNMNEKILFLHFNYKSIPIQFYEAFKKFCKIYFVHKFLTINDFKKFKFTMIGFNLAKINNKSLRSIEFLEQPSAIDELAQYGKDQEKIGKNLKNYLGFIPNEKIMLDNSIEFEGFNVAQVLSVDQLVSIGHEFNNCLRHDDYHYQDSLKNDPKTYFFVFRNKDNKRDKFIVEADIDAELKLLLKIQNCLGPSNQNVSSKNRNLLNNLLLSLDFIDVDLINQFSMKFLYEISQKNFDEAVNEIKEKANIFVSLLEFYKKTKTSDMPYLNENYVSRVTRRITKESEKFLLNFLLPTKLEKNINK